jgi:hypothetical protein
LIHKKVAFFKGCANIASSANNPKVARKFLFNPYLIF